MNDALVVLAFIVIASTKREVEEAFIPDLAHSMEVVAAFIELKLVSQVNGSAAPAAVASVPQIMSPEAVVSRAWVHPKIALVLSPAKVEVAFPHIVVVDVVPTVMGPLSEKAVVEAPLKNRSNVVVELPVCPFGLLNVQGNEKELIVKGLVPEHVVPPEQEPEMTPLLVIATEPPNTLRVALSSEIPVPAVIAPVVEATTLPNLSVDKALLIASDTTR